MGIVTCTPLARLVAALSLYFLVAYTCNISGQSHVSILNLRRRDVTIQPGAWDRQPIVRHVQNEKEKENGNPPIFDITIPDDNDDALPILNAEFAKSAEIIKDSYIVTWIAPENFARIFASPTAIDAWSANFTTMLDEQSKRLRIPLISTSRKFLAMPLLPGYSGVFDESTISKIRKDKANVRSVEQDCVIETDTGHTRTGVADHVASSEHLGHTGSVSENAAEAELFKTEQMKGRRLNKRGLPVTSPARAWGLPYLSAWDDEPIKQKWNDAGFPQGYRHMLGAGKGVRAYVMDAGIDSGHEDFKGRVESLPTQYPDHQRGQGPVDLRGHGTRIAGILGGSSVGVAPNVTLVEVLSTGGDPTGTTSIASMTNAAEQILWDVAYTHPETKATGSVLAMSVGDDVGSIGFADVIGKLRSHGVVTVVAAPNRGLDQGWQYPCGYGSVVCVGSINYQQRRAQHSDYIDLIDIVAPGEDVYTTNVPYAMSNFGGVYALVNGTSYAAPHVAGIVATILSYPGWKKTDYSPEQIADYARKILFANADFTGLGDFGLKLFARTGIHNPKRALGDPFYIPKDLEAWEDDLGRVRIGRFDDFAIPLTLKAFRDELDGVIMGQFDVSKMEALKDKLDREIIERFDDSEIPWGVTAKLDREIIDQFDESKIPPAMKALKEKAEQAIEGRLDSSEMKALREELDRVIMGLAEEPKQPEGMEPKQAGETEPMVPGMNAEQVEEMEQGYRRRMERKHPPSERTDPGASVAEVRNSRSHIRVRVEPGQGTKRLRVEPIPSSHRRSP